MSRVTKKTLQSQLYTLNMVLERPMEQFASKIGEPTRFNVGHICLLHDSSGYAVEEVVAENGAVHTLGSGMSANETYYLLRGMISGVALRNQHLGELLLRHHLHKAGLCEADHPLYNNPARHQARVINHADGTQSVVQA